MSKMSGELTVNGNIIKNKHIIKKNRRKLYGNLLFMLPGFILFAYVVLVPFLQGVPYSFTNWKSIIGGEKVFNGIKNISETHFYIHLNLLLFMKLEQMH